MMIARLSLLNQGLFLLANAVRGTSASGARYIRIWDVIRTHLGRGTTASAPRHGRTWGSVRYQLIFLCRPLLSLMLPSMRLVLLSRCAKATFIQRVRHLRFNLCGFSENNLFFGVSYARKTYDFQWFMMRNAKPAFAWLPFPIPFPHVLASAHSAVSFAKKNGEVGESVKQSQADDGGPCVPISWRAATEAVSTGRFSKTC